MAVSAEPARRRRWLLLIDAAVNLLLGVLLVAAPFGSLRWLGLPEGGSLLYPVVLGGVLIGIGGALWMARRGGDGLGLVGALVINVFGAGTAAAWLVLTSEPITVRGAVTLWTVVAVVLTIAAVELAALRR
jgi:hypothetical protein